MGGSVYPDRLFVFGLGLRICGGTGKIQGFLGFARNDGFDKLRSADGIFVGSNEMRGCSASLRSARNNTYLNRA